MVTVGRGVGRLVSLAPRQAAPTLVQVEDVTGPPGGSVPSKVLVVAPFLVDTTVVTSVRIEVIPFCEGYRGPGRTKCISTFFPRVVGDETSDIRTHL